MSQAAEVLEAALVFFRLALERRPAACCLVQPARNPACQFPWIIHLLHFLQCRDQVLVPLQQKREADYNLFCVESSFILVDNHVMTFWHLHRWWGAAWWWRPSPPPPWRRPATRPVSGDVSSGTQTCLWPKYPQCLLRSEHLMLETQIVMLTMTVMFISENIWSKKWPKNLSRSCDAQT